MTKTKKVILIHKRKSEEELIFDSTRKAAKHIGVSATQVSRILRQERGNNTDYFMTLA